MEEKKTEFLSEEPREVTPCDIMSDASYFLLKYPGANFRLEYSDGVVELYAAIPAKEAAV